MAGAAEPARDGLIGIAAPHVSPEGGWRVLPRRLSGARPRTSRPHLRDPGDLALRRAREFGLTRKNFSTPLGEAVADRRLVDWLAARGGGAVEMEDYCFSFEHTVEFQVVFLQHVLGPGVRSCRSSADRSPTASTRAASRRTTTACKRFFDALGELNDREGRPPALGARRGHGAHGRALRRPVPGDRERGRDERSDGRATSGGSSASTRRTPAASGIWSVRIATT